MRPSELSLLKRIQAEMESAIESYSPKAFGLVPAYQVQALKHANSALRGYILLRDAGEISASYLLLRSLLDTCFRLKAVRSDPKNLLRIANSEILGDQKWMEEIGKKLTPPRTDDVAGITKERILALRARFEEEHPELDISDVKEGSLDTRALAQKAGIVETYDAQWRLFSRHAHGDLSAMAGLFGDLDLREDIFVAGLMLDGLNILDAAGVDIPAKDDLFAEFGRLNESYLSSQKER